MGAYNQGILTPFDSLGMVPVEVSSVAIHHFVNRTPLYSRFPHLPVGSLSFKINSTQYRPSTATLSNGSAVTAGATSFTLADASYILQGDILEIENEQVQVTADPVGDAVAVARGMGGTAAASHNDGLTVYVVGNTRTGGEINQVGISRIPSPVIQNLQTIQHPVQVSGSLDGAYDYALPLGVGSLMGFERLKAMQEVADDYERSAYYGRGVALQSGTASRPQMTGLRSLLVTNNTQSPTNAAAYKPSDLVRDAVQPCFQHGGNPDVLIVSTDFMTGLEIWGMAVQRLEAGTTMFGTPIDVFEAPFLTGVSIIPAPLLRPGTAICLTSSEIRNRTKRAMFDKPRGSRGDANESDIILEAAVEVDNEHHHAWVSGITAFSAS